MMIVFMTPYRFITSLMNSTAASELAVATGLALIHLVNLSIMINKWSKPLGLGGSFLTRSSPQMVKGHVIGIVWSS